MNEIEDAMFGRRQSRYKGGPGDWALWRCRCAEPAEPAVLAELGKIWQIAPMALDEAGVHSVHSEHDQFWRGMPTRTAAS